MARLAEFEKWDEANGYERRHTTAEELRKRVEELRARKLQKDKE